MIPKPTNLCTCVVCYLQADQAEIYVDADHLVYWCISHCDTLLFARYVAFFIYVLI